MRYPRDWYGDASAGTLAVTSYPVHEPDQAVRLLPSDGAFIYIIDYPAYSVSTRRSPPRPHRISLRSLGNYDVFGKAYRIEFRDRQHGILAFVAVGDHASSATRATAVAVLNSIGVWPPLTVAARAQKHCPIPPDFGPNLDVTSGPAGSMVTISGAYSTLGEGGNYKPTSRFRVWWNLDTGYPSPGVLTPAPAVGGSALVSVGRDDVSSNSTCTYRVHFQVPRASPGTYPVVALAVAPDGSTASAGFANFHVTP